MNNWKFAVSSIGELKNRGLCAGYHILIDGKNPYTGETEADYINKGFAVLDESEFEKIIGEYEDSICGNWNEISEEFYEQQLNVLPPMLYYDGGFYISEADTGNIHGFYQAYGGKFYTSLQRTSTPRSAIIEQLHSAIMRGVPFSA